MSIAGAAPAAVDAEWAQKSRQSRIDFLEVLLHALDVVMADIDLTGPIAQEGPCTCGNPSNRPK